MFCSCTSLSLTPVALPQYRPSALSLSPVADTALLLLQVTPVEMLRSRQILNKTGAAKTASGFTVCLTDSPTHSETGFLPLVESARTVVREGGVLSLWRALPLTVLRDGPGVALYLYTFKRAKLGLSTDGTSSDLTLPKRVLAGIIFWQNETMMLFHVWCLTATLTHTRRLTRWCGLLGIRSPRRHDEDSSGGQQRGRQGIARLSNRPAAPGSGRGLSVSLVASGARQGATGCGHHLDDIRLGSWSAHDDTRSSPGEVTPSDSGWSGRSVLICSTSFM